LPDRRRDGGRGSRLTAAKYAHGGVFGGSTRKSKPVPLYYALCKPITNGISINPAFDIHFYILFTASFTWYMRVTIGRDKGSADYADYGCA
jgi:hypothetical protein